MATVTGLTADRMKQIESSSVVNGSVVGDNLVLTTKGGSTIVAGNVRGPQGLPGLPGAKGEAGVDGLPAVPTYYASRRISAGLGTMQSVEYTVPWDSVVVAGNVPYDTADKAYVIPLDGLWEIGTQVTFNNPSTTMRSEFRLRRIRGTLDEVVYATIVTFGGGSSTWVSAIAPYMIPALAGDKLYVEVRPNGGTCTLYMNLGFHFFNIRLLDVVVP